MIRIVLKQRSQYIFIAKNMHFFERLGSSHPIQQQALLNTATNKQVRIYVILSKTRRTAMTLRQLYYYKI